MNTMIEPAVPSPRRAPIALWRALHLLLATMIDLFGAPQEIAAALALTRKTHSLILPWLRAGEAFLRRLLLIEALALAPLAARPSAPTAPRVRPRQPSADAFAPEAPWRVRFRLFEHRSASVRRRAGGSRSRRTPIWTPFLAPLPRPRIAAAPTLPRDKSARAERALAPLRFPAARPVAARLEALLRAYKDPLPLARRFAGLLAGRPSRAARVLRPQSRAVHNMAGRRYFRRAEKLARQAIASFGASADTS